MWLRDWTCRLGVGVLPGPDPPPLPSGVSSALHEWWPVLLPKPVPVSPGLHGSLLPGARRWRRRGHRRLRPWDGPGRNPVHRRIAAPGSGERVCGQQARHLCGPGDRRSVRAWGGAPCTARSLPGAPRARTDLSGRYGRYWVMDGRTGEDQSGWSLGWGDPRGGQPWRSSAPQPTAQGSPEATVPPPPSPGPAPRGERARPPPTRGLGPSAPHRRVKCGGPSLFPAPAATPEAPAPQATHPEAPGPLLPGHAAQAACE